MSAQVLRQILLRLGVFLIALLAWYVTALFLSGFGAVTADTLPYLFSLVVFTGSLYALPIVIIAAVADAVAALWFPHRPLIGFLLLVIVGLAAAAAIAQYGFGVPLIGQTDQFPILNYPGRSTLAVIAVYAIANAVRGRSGGGKGAMSSPASR